MESALTASKAQANSDKTRLDELAVEPIILKNRLEELRRLEADLATLRNSLKLIPGSMADDAQTIEDIDQIRRKAIAAIENFIG